MAWKIKAGYTAIVCASGNRNFYVVVVHVHPLFLFFFIMIIKVVHPSAYPTADGDP